MEAAASSSRIESRVENMKRRLNLSSKQVDPYSFVCPSAYDTAWLAMIPAQNHSGPMFRNCLNWLLRNQNEDGFWGHTDAFGNPTIHTIPSTLASMVALNMWNSGPLLIQKGLSFIHENAEEILKDVKENCPRWFAIVLPAMLELAHANGLQVVFPEAVMDTLSYVFTCRQNILHKEKMVGEGCYPPLLSYLEAVPESYEVREEDILRNVSGDGSIFQSPSATAKAFMATRNKDCFNYLKSLAQRCANNGVPQTYPMDEDLIKLCMVNQLEKLGLAHYFLQDINETLAQIHRNFMDQKSWAKPYNTIATQLHKDSLAFLLLRMHGYRVSPSRFCWFLHDEKIRGDMEKHGEYFISAVMNVYKASNLMFSEEYEAEEAMSFSSKLLKTFIHAEKSSNKPHLVKVKPSTFHKMIEHELNLPWLARLEHLEHRMWIEEKEANSLWVGKTSHNRISHIHNDGLLQLAIANFEQRQFVYKNELEELKRWSEELGLTSMGFGREKTTYCYYAMAASTSSFIHDCYIRMLVAKSAIIITVADDFFDMEASLCELEYLTDAIRRWEIKGLSKQSKVIFNALDKLVSEVAARYLIQEGTDITNSLRDLWYETFGSWLVEAKWSRKGHAPSIDDYLNTATISIAVHTLVLPASCFLKPRLHHHQLRPPHYETITKLLMLLARLLNDLQSYQKEKEEGKLNYVLINMIEKPELEMEESVGYVREIIGRKKKEFLEHALVDGKCDWPEPSRHFHLSCLKVFQMFFNSTNRYDSTTDMLQDINKAIYLPLTNTTKHDLNNNNNKPLLNLHSRLNKIQYYTTMNPSFSRFFMSVVASKSQATIRNGVYGRPQNALMRGFI